jgi:2-dehydro-3-deoxyphosphogluconate aldolase/(4S)-4-hydroxy-2-oxoglutarate aldolase
MIREMLSRAPVIPVLTIARVEDAVAIGEALAAGGLAVIEVTLRSAAALPAIAALRRALPDAVIGAGTVVNAAQFAAAVDAGSQFIVAPGFSPELAAAARRHGVPLLPGVMTPSELMAASAAGIDTLKLFPAEPAGGIALLKAFAAPFPEIAFCPTGGISMDRAPHYLAEPNVLCVGMSSLVTPASIAARDWAGIRARAALAAALTRRGDRA